ncbi:hypothetical protein PP356_gp43 [Arthrobacter phage MargaretKali]|uniref:Uncharacterized protein n=1 Tax=Arthrobacter phage MargaretKali TaxID=2250414 RepID=A0A345KN21_9CAUD|nr:hypothetical protein PP356_gp43 [Arthrobacter phage MargaretKali]AXH44423.1 hypothetical protein SEA_MARGARETKALI_43 [Arthrobacter phage MargaretKali]
MSREQIVTDVPALLQPMKDRLAAATPGPWHQGRESNRWENSREVYSEREVSATSTDVATAIHKPEDSALIASAPTDQAKLIAAIEAVAAPHQESFREVEPWEMGYKYTGHHCIEDGEQWPCDTIAALTQALGGDTA